MHFDVLIIRVGYETFKQNEDTIRCSLVPPLHSDYFDVITVPREEVSSPSAVSHNFCKMLGKSDQGLSTDKISTPDTIRRISDRCLLDQSCANGSDCLKCLNGGPIYCV